MERGRYRLGFAAEDIDAAAAHAFLTTAYWPMPELRRLVQVDVFTAAPLNGNALAVVDDGAGLPEDAMAAFARRTNLSGTALLPPPTDPGADYRVRIFTPGGELRFAGHPTLRSAHAFLASGGDAKRPGFVAMQGLKLGVDGAHPAGGECQFEVRAFVPDLGVPEDPVTGSLNAGLAMWLQHGGRAGDHGVAAQGAALGRAGRHVRRDAEATRIGGDVTPLIRGQVRL